MNFSVFTGARWRVVLITNDTNNINEPLLRFCTTVNWDSITFEEKKTKLCEELSWPKCLQFNITKALKVSMSSPMYKVTIGNYSNT